MSNFYGCYQFHFHNVGQGLFYTGQIENFIFVYDCGSRSVTSVKRAIDRWLSTHSYSKLPINVLVISHLDYDHVSGLDYFLERMPVKLVIMPYVSRFERILLALRANGVPDWYVSFMEDPVEYILGTQKEIRIILVLPSEDGDERKKLPKPFRENDFTDWQWEFNEELWRALEPQLEEEKEETRHRWRAWLKSGRLDFRTHQGSVFPVRDWKFRFFVQKAEYLYLKKFRDCMYNCCDTLKLQEILRCIRKRAQLRECYEYITGKKDTEGNKKRDINSTSLVLYHGPLKGATTITLKCTNKNKAICFCYVLYCCHVPKPDSDCLATLLSGPAPGQLLLGDLDLTKNYSDFADHMRSELQSTAVCLLPHHGSKHSWKSALMDDASRCRLWVASVGRNNKRNLHPSPSVIQDILQGGNIFVCVDELRNLSLIYSA
ncbi:MAG: MBL fold metallo-hydrolase [Moorellaceae bacterium]